MNRSLRLAVLLCGLVFSVMVYAQPSSGRLAGTWQSTNGGAVQNLVLQSDGSGSFNNEVLKYEVQGKFLAVVTGNETIVYAFQLEGNQLTISGGDLDGAMVFTRIQGNASAKDPSFSNTSKELIGTWSGDGEVIEFRPDGICRYNETLIPYRLSQGHVILDAASGSVSFAYTIKANRLLLSANGQQAAYERVKTPTHATTATRQVKNPSDLVGQWCYLKSSTGTYSGRCITLNADGTYLYTEERSMSVQTEDLSGGTASQGSDSGRWYVQGDRLYYESTTRGTGSYRLERRNHPKNVNDPMIVLDDEPFVTTTRRPPWR